LGRPSRFQAMESLKGPIASLVKEEKKNVFLLADIRRLLTKGNYLLGLPGRVTIKEFIEFLDAKKILHEIAVTLPLEKKVARYQTANANAFELALSLKGNSYLSHYSAVFLHGLTDNLPKTIYANTELKMTRNMNSLKLEQDSIDTAFNRNIRQSNQIARYEDLEIFLLNSKNVDHAGVKEFDLNGVKLQVTDIERTLIDITVRPNYAGGVYEVLNAYIAAKNKVSVNRLVATLKKLDYTYPYHQAIGFYMEKAGYDEKVLRLLENLEIKYKFYLTYKMQLKEYSKRWKLFYPRGLDLID